MALKAHLWFGVRRVRVDDAPDLSWKVGTPKLTGFNLWDKALFIRTGPYMLIVVLVLLLVRRLRSYKSQCVKR
jgi:hypothetical protein